MSTNLIAEEQSQHMETVAGSPIAISSYRLGETYYAKAEIDQPGAKARIAVAQGFSRGEAESQVLAEVRRSLEKRG